MGIVIFAGGSYTIGKSFTSPWEIHELISSEFDSSWIFKFDKEIDAPWRILETPPDKEIESKWDLGHLVQTFGALWAIRILATDGVLGPWDVKERDLIEEEEETLWAIKVSNEIMASWKCQLVAERSVEGIWSLRNLLDLKMDSLWAMRSQVSHREYDCEHSILEHSLVDVGFVGSYALLKDQHSAVSAPTVIVRRKDTGQVLEIVSGNIHGDEDSYLWQFSAVMRRPQDWNAIRPTVTEGIKEVEVIVDGQTWCFMIEDVSRSRVLGRTEYELQGRSKTCYLDSPYATLVDKTWDAPMNVSAIANDLSIFEGINLQWDTVDWLLPAGKLNAKSEAPISIISRLAEAVGAILQSSKDGETLIVRPKHIISPTSYAVALPDFVISDISDIRSCNESWDNRPGYNSILISDVSSEDYGSVKITIDEVESNVSMTLRVSCEPWRDIILQHSAESFLSLTYLGEFTEEIDEIVEIVEGKGTVKDYFYGLISSEYIKVDLGAITITEAGIVTTGVLGQSLLSLKYLTKYRKYRIVAAVDLEHAQIFIEE